ncbi:MAG: hypothetical protein ACI9XP_000944 [Lentimonas sp.]|jgi:hypothetical protein
MNIDTVNDTFYHKTRRFFSLTLLCLITQNSFSQSAMGGWTLHVPSRKAIGVAASGNVVYTAYTNGILEYDLDFNEKSLLTAVNGLSDIQISAIEYDSKSNSIFVGYENGNIDKIQGNSITNIPAIKLAEIQGVKKINRFLCQNGFVYASTGFGIVKIDPVKNEIRETYFPTVNNSPIKDLVIQNDTIFALIEGNLLKAKLSNPALADPNQWSIDSRVSFDDLGRYADIEVIQNEIILSKVDPAFGKDSVFLLDYSGNQVLSIEAFEFEVRSLSNTNGKLCVNLNGGVFVYNTDFSKYFFTFNKYPAGLFSDANDCIFHKDKYYIADNQSGLAEVSPNGDSRVISIDGPPKPDTYNLDWERGVLGVAGGGLSDKFFTYNISGVYRLEDNEWTIAEHATIPAWDTINIYDFIAVAINPNDNKKSAVSSYTRYPLTIFSDVNEVEKIYTPENSALAYTSLNNSACLISDLQYDSRGNLWLLNGFTQDVLKVLTPQDTWLTFDLGPGSRNNFTREMLIDNNDNIWITSNGQGLFVLDYNETLDDPTDDRVQHLTTGELSGNLPANDVSALAADFDDEIWIGTEDGFAILYNSDFIFDAAPGDFNVQRTKIEFEGNVEFLLGNTNITDIEIDGGNRKWIGTFGAGIFMLSSDGLSIETNFTAENSPLISNNINDMEIDHNTGEMYIITDQGMVSYRIDASYEDPNYESVVVFPNPVRPEFTGVITIQGIRYDSDITITDMGGNSVYKTTSNGGTATWDGYQLNGEKASSGVYLIWTAPSEGKGRKVGKFVLISSN